MGLEFTLDVTIEDEFEQIEFTLGILTMDRALMNMQLVKHIELNTLLMVPITRRIEYAVCSTESRQVEHPVVEMVARHVEYTVVKQSC